jgi:ABC-type multidrug transport system fused ATPase/permease subunit
MSTSNSAVTTPTRLGILSSAPGWSALAAAATIGTAVAALLQPAAIGRVVDAIARHRPAGPPLVVLAVVLAIGGLTAAIGALATGVYAANTTRRLRGRLGNHVIGLGVRARSAFSSGDLTSRLTTDTATPAAIVPTALSLGVSLVTSVGGLIALSVIDWRMTVTFLVGLPVIVLVVRRFVVDAGNLTHRYRELQAEIANRLVDAFAGIRTIQVSGTRDREIARVTAPLVELGAIGRRLWMSQRRVSWQSGLLLSLVEVLVLGVGGFELAAGRLQAGGLLAAAGYVSLILAGFDGLEAAMQAVQARVGVARTREVLSVDAPRSDKRATATLPADGRGGLVFDNVTVRRDGHTVLDGVSLNITAGTCVALVGVPGSGKSTLAALVGGLMEPDAGRVLIDGIDVDAIESHDLHAAVSYAFERPARLGATVHELIALGSPHHIEAGVRVEQAARAAHADDFIRRLPGGYDTPLDRAPFSGGELQRLGIAQALMRPARVLVFDDATSSLDVATEQDVLTAIESTAADRTSLIVTHRLTVAARADLVVWLEKGSVKGCAPHRDLCRDPEYVATVAPAAVKETACS